MNWPRFCLKLDASYYTHVANHTDPSAITRPSGIPDYFHISSTVFLIDFYNRRIRHHFLELSVPFQEAPTGKLQTSEQPWQLLLFFLQLSNAAEWNLGLWWSLRKWGVLGFHMSTSHFHWAPRCLSSWCGTRWCLLWRQIDIWLQSKTGLLQHKHVQTPPPISSVLYQLQKKNPWYIYDW